jgi:methylmalonyl-CoA mutase N-terminal domain/subunit
MGGMLAAIERNFPQQEIADAAYRYQRQIDEREKVVVGVNKYITDDDVPVETLEIDQELENLQIEKTNRVKNERDNADLKRSIEKLEDACSGTANIMESVIDAVKNFATLQEVCDVYRKVFGEYRDPGIY